MSPQTDGQLCSSGGGIARLCGKYDVMRARIFRDVTSREWLFGAVLGSIGAHGGCLVEVALFGSGKCCDKTVRETRGQDLAASGRHPLRRLPNEASSRNPHPRVPEVGGRVDTGSGQITGNSEVKALDEKGPRNNGMRHSCREQGVWAASMFE